MPQNSFSITENTILSALSAGIRGEKYLAEKGVDWKAVFAESKAQAVCLALYDALKPENQIPSQIREEFESLCAKSISQNMTVHTYHNYLHNLMEENAIDYCVIKGSSSALYYKNPLLRAMGDVDFLVREEDLERAKEVLLKDGFSVYEEKHISHIVFKKKKMHLEMHFALPGMPQGKYGLIIENELKDIFQKATLTQVEGMTFKTPSPYHHGLILLMHTYHHMLGEGVGLRHLCDFAEFLNSFKEEEFSEIFKERLEKCGLWEFARIFSFVSSKYLDVPYKTFMGEVDGTLAQAVIEDIFAGGNFGIKDEKRANEGLAISDRGKDGVNKSTLLQFIKTVNNAAKVQFPFIKRHKILHPVGFVAFIFRRGFRVLKGTRKMPDFRGTIKGAKRRKELYSQFRLFEEEEN